MSELSESDKLLLAKYNFKSIEEEERYFSENVPGRQEEEIYYYDNITKWFKPHNSTVTIPITTRTTRTTIKSFKPYKCRILNYLHRIIYGK